MLFSTNIFLFVFLPIVILIYYLFLRKHIKLKNTFLLIVSLLFYAWSEPKFLLVMVASILLNWIFGLLIDKYRNRAKIFLILSIIANLSIIFVFKYIAFAVENINSIFNLSIGVREIVLPLGISFFTFQAMSYVIDVYRDKVKVQKNLIKLALFVSFFPQLIAGPIVRYETIADQIDNRKETFDKFSEGVCRFIIGLGKKVIIANSIAIVADKAFSLNELSVSMAWMGVIAYTIQIFFDFSGYSDMAIGLGKMFGFDFLENFNYPYISKSISEFWRRWHISLGTWFKDYVYIPLGGNRVKTKRLIFNLFIVWSLTGLWHGANWTFILWGIMYFALITFEKLFKFDEKVKNNIFKHIYTMFFVILGWILFRSDTLSEAVVYIKNMLGLNSNVLFDNVSFVYFMEYVFYFIIGILFSLPIKDKLENLIKNKKAYKIAEMIIIILIFAMSITYVNESVYNPFIYFNF